MSQLDRNIRRIPVTIYNRDYLIRTDETVEHVNRLAGILDRKMRQISMGNPNAPEIRLAVLAALTVLDEHTRLEEEYKGLLETLDKATEPEKPVFPEGMDPGQQTLDDYGTDE